MTNADPDDPDTLATVVADGTPVDWDALTARAVTPEARIHIARFALLARVAAVHASAAGPDDDASHAPPGDPSHYRPGDHWGQLRIVARLAAGTFGVVYRAHDHALARDVALKILHASPGGNDDLAADVVTEGRLLARVRHPHVVTVHGADRHDGRVGIWMELIEGQTLEDELAARGPLPPAEVVAAGITLAGALHAVHAAGLLHRDLKTQNVMRDGRDGRLVLMDFSAGREQFDAVDEQPWPATLAGSPLYLAPELFDGTPASVRSDVYSLGVVLFRLLTTRFPVGGDSLAEIEGAHRRRAAADRAARGDPGVSGAMRAVMRALDPDPAKRQQSARALLDELQAVSDRAARARRMRWAAAVVLLAGGVSVGLFSAGASSGAGRWFGAGGAPLRFAERDHVLIADFENRTGDASFDDVLEQALTRELTMSRHLNVVPRARIEDALTLMRQPLDAPLDERRAREVSLRDGGVRAFLTGSISRVGTSYVLTTDILNPADGAVHARIEDDVSERDALLLKVREQALRVREALGETMPALAGTRQELAQVTTPSLDALQLYSRAAALLEGDAWLSRDDATSQYEAADAMLAQALENDPDFASAWILRARAASARGRPAEEYLAHAERARSLISTVTIHERYLIEGLVRRLHADAAPYRRDDLVAAAQSLGTLVQLVPDHYWALIELGQIYRRLRRLDDAERTVLHAAALRPNSIHFAVGAAEVHLRRRERAAVEQLADKVLAVVPAGLEEAGGSLSRDVAWLRGWKASDAWLSGDVAQVAVHLQALEAEGHAARNTYLHHQLVQAWHGLGRFDEARRIARTAAPFTAEAFENLLDGRQERWRELRPRLIARQTQFWQVDRFKYHYIWAGLLDPVEWLLAERKRQRMTHDWQGYHELEGQLRVAQGRYAEALELFAPVLADEQFPRLRMHYDVARARHGMGDHDGAILTLERFEREPMTALSFGWGTYDWLRCATLLAEYYLAAGQTADATRVADRVRALLVLADEEHPLRARLADLP